MTTADPGVTAFEREVAAMRRLTPEDSRLVRQAEAAADVVAAGDPVSQPGRHAWIESPSPGMEAFERARASLRQVKAPDADPVSRPAHYTRLQPEPRDVIVAWGLNWNRGSAVAYIARAGHKVNEVEDLEKAIECLRHEVEFLKKAI